MVMKKYMINRGDRTGSAIVAAMLIAFCLALAGAAILGLTGQHVRSVARVRDHIQAQMIAEAGANAAYAMLKADWDARLDPGNFPWTLFSEGSYDAEVTPVGNNGAVIQCVGECRGVQAEVIVDVQNRGTPGSPPSGPLPPVGAYECSILAGAIDWGGNGQTTGGGKVHSNSFYDQSGTTDAFVDQVTAVTRIYGNGSVTLTADCVSPSYQKKFPARITGTATVGPVAPIPIPDIDLTPYYHWALANGEVYASDPGHYQPVGGVMWVEGDVHISGGANINGCIIATGDMHITGNSNYSRVGDLPCLISRDGSIHLSSHIYTEGLMYVPNGDIALTGGGEHTGSIFCSGTLKKTGSWGAVNYANSTPPADPDPSHAGTGATDDVVITCWHK
jgi:hypothetical protein